MMKILTVLLILFASCFVFNTGCEPVSDEYKLTIQVSPGGTVVAVNIGVVEPPEKVFLIRKDTTVGLKAIPNTGRKFSHWDGSVDDVTSQETFVYVNIDTTIKAFFIDDPDIIYVPQDYETIQQAIDNADNGFTIIVAPGTYQERIDFKGKNIKLRSEDPSDPDVVDNTIIDGSPLDAFDDGGSVVTIATGESNQTVLSGFTITGGDAENGGGIYIFNSNPTITYNHIRQNKGQYGAGIYVIMPATEAYNFGSISKNCIEHNNASDSGGGILVLRGEFNIGDNVISNNAAGGKGGGIAVTTDASPKIVKNTLRLNEASQGGGISVFGDGQSGRKRNPAIEENIIINNSASSSGGGISVENSYAFITGNTIEQNTCNFRGGGIYADSRPGMYIPFMIENTITANTSNSDGGGIYLASNGLEDEAFLIQAAITGNDIMENIAENGGGIYLRGDAGVMSPEIKENRLIDNTAFESGGGIMIRSIKPVLSDNLITLNQTENGSGGGICIISHTRMGETTYAVPAIFNNTFTYNSAAEYGGGIFVEQGNSVTNEWGTVWEKALVPPAEETLNSYESNEHSHGIEGSDVYFEMD